MNEPNSGTSSSPSGEPTPKELTTHALPNDGEASSRSPEQTKMRQVFAATHFSGPLPDPSTLERYSAINPEIVPHCIRHAELEQTHRHRQEASLVQAQIQDATDARRQAARGQWLGSGIAVVFIIGGVAFAYMGKPWMGLVSLGPPLIGVVAIVVTATRSSRGPRHVANKDSE